MPALLWLAAASALGDDWLIAAVLAFVCTGLAYILYFRLIAHAGPANAITVTFLIPVFAVVWGWHLPRRAGHAADGRRLRRHLARHRARDRPAAWPLRTRPPRDNPRPARS